MKTKIYAAITMAALLSACTTIKPIEDTPPHLGPGQGIAAVTVFNDKYVSRLDMGAISGNGAPLLIQAMPEGMHVYLFVAAAGTYCAHSFIWHDFVFNTDSSHECFEVLPGKMSYSGVYSVVAGSSGNYVSGNLLQQDDWDAFTALLEREYPNIAAATFATADTVAKEQAASAPAPRPSTGICAFLSADEASTLLGVKVNPGQEVNGITPTCMYSYSDQQAVHLSRMRGSHVDAATLDSITPGIKGGWSKPIDIPGLGDQARYDTLGHTAQLLVLQDNRVLFYLTVDGSTIPNLQDAMAQTGKTLLARFLEQKTK
jgi:hypothetical protein